MSNAHNSPRGMPSPGVQVNNTPQGGRRRQVYSATLITNLAVGVSYSDVTAKFQMDIPSVRLHTKVSIGFRPYNAESTPFAAGGAAAWVWRMDEWNRDERGRPVVGNNVFTNRPLPASWETATGSDQWRGEVTVPGSEDGSGILVDGELIIIAMWEPAAGAEISDQELAQLFQSCHLRVTKAINVAGGFL